MESKESYILFDQRECIDQVLAASSDHIYISDRHLEQALQQMPKSVAIASACDGLTSLLTDIQDVLDVIKVAERSQQKLSLLLKLDDSCLGRLGLRRLFQKSNRIPIDNISVESFLQESSIFYFTYLDNTDEAIFMC